MIELDYFTKMVLAGMMAVVIETAIDYLQYKFHTIENTVITYAASILLPDDEPLDKLSAQAVGLMGHFIMGAGAGIIIGLVLLFTGASNAYLKGMGVGAFYWLIMHRGLTSKFWVKPSANISSGPAAIEILKHILIGLLTVRFSFWLS
ncbi:hypothetical protein E4K67_01815 [Desulfosporosinus fructosivorans]|uniref:DUF2938 family protein n=1 Tax=Desulfosporosinus fructosivorans TaxID=2018669 RepID=A0A4Z0RDZ1_9FIRM|nr:hypothetical protein [Desulfosporosinus fructosivorans]TGE39756.1 hypothetical protein E4K67_01815 [Desulfosporosinus fructosivorans]